MPAGLYSQVNLRTGRVLTTVPLVGWGGNGPGIYFALYHNMTSPWSPIITPIQPGTLGGSSAMGDANSDGGLDVEDIDPFLDIVLTPEQSSADLEKGDFDANGEVDSADFGTLIQTLELQAGGPQWTHSYSAHLLIDSVSNAVTLVRDDGTRDVFTPDGQGGYVSPAGVFDVLTHVPCCSDSTCCSDPQNPCDVFILRSKSQAVAVFERRPQGDPMEGYRLRFVADASGNRAMCVYLDDVTGNSKFKLGSVTDVTSSPERYLELEYRPNGFLRRITANVGYVGEYVSMRWDLRYEGDTPPANPCSNIDPTTEEDGDGEFVGLFMPLTINSTPCRHYMGFEYTSVWEISKAIDQEGNAYELEYTSGRLTRVIDPVNPASPTEPRLKQEFVYGPGPTGTGSLLTTYRNRRGYEWLVGSKSSNGNLLWVEEPLGYRRDFSYEQFGRLQHEITRVTDIFGRNWRAHYDTNGNVDWTADPLDTMWGFQYDVLNNLTTVVPPSDAPMSGNATKQVLIEYEDSEHPTSPTAIIEPELAGAPDGPAVTTIEYYTDVSSNPESNPACDESRVTGPTHGRIHRVTPPHTFAPVATEYTYDGHGHVDEEREGLPTGGAPLSMPPEPVVINHNSNGLGWPTGGNDGVFAGGVGYDANGNVTSTTGCKDVADTPPPSALGGTITPIPECFPPGDGYCCQTWPPPAGCTAILKRQERPAQVHGCFTEVPSYNKMGMLLEAQLCVKDDGPFGLESKRTMRYEYDHLYRPVSAEVATNEPTTILGIGVGVAVSRTFHFNPDWASGIVTSTGPDGSVSVVQLDTLGRVAAFTRSIGGDQVVSAVLEYYTDSSLYAITYGNGLRTWFDYDLAGRVAGIYHETTTPEPILSLEYVWSRDGLVEQVTETDADGLAFITEYDYDQRNRLVEEFRYPVVPGPMSYHFRYTYDKAGNRLLKEDLLAGVNTGYTYDVQDPERYGSQGNRMVESRRYIAATDEPIESRIYLYDKAGRVTQVVRTIAGDVAPEHDDAQWHRGTEFWYNTRGQLWMARGSRWQLEGEELPGGGVATRVVNAEYLSAMEYRYDSGRRRYMTRRCDPGSMAPLTAEASWHDYLGDSIHADHGVDYDPGQSLVVEEKAAHVPGVARYDHGSAAGDRVRQLLGNLIGTTEAECVDDGTLTGRTVYTAFGEAVTPGGMGVPPVAGRYGYAGAWGYQSPGNALCGPPGEEIPCDPLAELGWLHVGERYYDPSSGRFVQRDPIGIRGGANVYVYVGSEPTRAIDPYGLASVSWFDQWPEGSHSVLDGLGGGSTFLPGSDPRGTRIVYRYDAVGRAHNGISTPHTHVYFGNLTPDGSVRPYGPCGPIKGPPPVGPPPSTAAGKALKGLARMADLLGRVGMIFDAVIIECNCGAGGIGMARGPGCRCGA